MRRTVLSLLVGLLATAAFATSAQAAIQIDSFDTTSSSSLAGDHPDLGTHFELGDSDTGVAKTVVFNAPQGIFGNPNVLSLCTALDFAQQQCAPNSQSGLITIRADYEGDSAHLLGTVPIYAVEPGPDDAARFAFYAPILEIPISIPVSVRSGTDYGLRFTVSGITQLVPLKKVDMTFWGFPSSPAHNMERFAKGSAGKPGRLRRARRHQLHHRTDRLHRPAGAVHRLPVRMRSGDDDDARCRELPGTRAFSRTPRAATPSSPNASARPSCRSPRGS